MTAPVPSFDHLFRLSDETGLLEHANGPLPRREHGYCVDDVARGLVVICRQPAPAPALVALAERYLTFLAHAQNTEGQSHNRFGYDRRWLDEPGVGDWWGRGLWAFGAAAARAPGGWMAEEALHHFELGAGQRSPWCRAMAFAALGAIEVTDAYPDHHGARQLLAHATVLIGRPGTDADWPWPEPRLTYANAVLPDVLLGAGSALQDERMMADGLTLLGWLLKVETSSTGLSLTPCGGWGSGERRPGFDQQPIEAAALADACARAYRLTGDQRWSEGVTLAVEWFLGRNDAGVSLLDPRTGGGYDGLEAGGRNANQGAESTLALISTLQLGASVGARS